MLEGCVGWPAEYAERYRAAGYWTGETFGALLDRVAETYGSRTAVVDGDRRITYAELRRRADRLAGGFAGLGVGPGDRVVVQLPNVAEFFDVVFALFRLGALPVFALPAHRASEVGYFVAKAAAKAYVTVDTHGGFDHRTIAGRLDVEHAVVLGDAGGLTALADLYREPVDAGDRDAGDVAFFQLSGGSTGVPKLIPRTHDDYLYSVRASAEICGLSERTVYLCALPVAHNFPLSSPGVLGVLHAGGTVVLAPAPSPDVAFPLVARERVTITALVPPLALVWLDAAAGGTYDLSSLRVLQVGGAKLSAAVAARVRPVLGCTLQQVFGMAEGLVNYTRLDDPDDVCVGTQGRPMSPADEVRVVDDDGRDLPAGRTGHLLTRGPYTIRGYYDVPEHDATAFTADGFYRTGDVVSRTADGYLVVEGRAKDQINRGGEKIAAEEVENHLLGHAAVHDAAVVSMPDAYLGERTCAYVVARGEPPRVLELKRYLRDRVAAYKVPDRIVVVDAFPVTGVGKVSKSELRRALTRSLAEGSGV